MPTIITTYRRRIYRASAALAGLLVVTNVIDGEVDPAALAVVYAAVTLLADANVTDDPKNPENPEACLLAVGPQSGTVGRGFTGPLCH